MEKPGFLKVIDDFENQQTDKKSFLRTLKKHVNCYEKEKEVLLELSNDITKVRTKVDLIKVFSSGLKSLFYFTHAVVSLVDKEKQTYYPFLIDREALKIKHRDELPSLLASRFVLDDPFISKAHGSDIPVSFLLDDIINKPGIPGFLKVNYECGIKEAMIVPLKSKMETIGHVLVYSDRPGSFSDDFKAVISMISPQLSSAVSNIKINEEIEFKEWVNEVLLDISNNLVTVRHKKDLLTVVNAGLKKLVKFTHNVMTIVDKAEEYYSVYVTDPDSPTQKFPKYGEAVELPNLVNDGIYDAASDSEGPVVLDMTLFDLDKAPLWFKLNYAAGAREMVVNILPGKAEHKLGLILFADKKGAFDAAALNIVERISSQLFTAASNIAANEEIANKEKEKSFLLDFSHDIAAVRSKHDLSAAVERAVKKLSSVKGYTVRLINCDGATTSTYIYDSTNTFKDDPEFRQMIAAKFPIKDGIQDKVLSNTEPVLFITNEEMRRAVVPQYVRTWSDMGLRKMLGVALRTGNKDIGVLFMETDIVNLPILKGICAQISTAISNVLVNEQLITYKSMLEVENDHLKEQINTIYNAAEIVGNGPEMQQVYHLMSIVAKTNSTVLLTGETGTGKELAARGIHKSSPRKDKLMIKVNCAALPANLIESELFGHERGAFTGAVERRIGKFEQAHNSTLFLDEIGELPLELQVKLLRVIQEREFERIGGKTTIKVDVRIIAATNRNLEEEVNAGRFRADLYYRLNVFPISLPPLRNRIEDIAQLANYFLARHSKNTGIKVTAISSKVMQELKSYLWPGNVRELEHLLERSVLLTNGSTLREIYLPKTRFGKDLSVNQTLEEIERAHIIQTLKICGGKIAGSGGAADVLGTPSTTLHAKMKKLKISKTDYLSQAS
ncbi:Transcriptional regulator containing GAF, AAA-type ATPase, and DNA-binding Fis domains [Mucilaginibacter gossypiicola]|uniref:Transcriptional regulator containing GAF, AAA-type ATPase, and DNA-binding Fis domains n=1 Tax=Mucilaginibacter gossypiicola TaxID=551995 RepID=A0A1H8BF58_9SPHI|nr:sigma 54-interacting transcriptional regulator [Mucilaginibacter gossypiicola]SEM80497.1 Transcriptional regulator containing GAF, AAA-type ATPase, and DNA-binding Fis domains [Mucilaginibacter gossypiicola]